MPIGSAKIGVLGAGLVPGGTQTFNASGTFTVPPGVKKVNITGRGGTGNPGNAGNPGNSGNPGTGGAGGGGGTGYAGSQNTTPVPMPGGGGGFALRDFFCGYKTTFGVPSTPSIQIYQPLYIQGRPGTTPLIPNTALAQMTIGGYSGGGPGPGGCNPNQANNAESGISGNAGSAGTAGNPGNPGQASSGLCKTFPGGAGGNAGVAGAAGNGGSGGTAGGKGNFYSQGTGAGSAGNGAGAGGCGVSYSTNQMNSSFKVSGGGGGGGAGVNTNGFTGAAASGLPQPQAGPISPALYARGGDVSGYSAAFPPASPIYTNCSYPQPSNAPTNMVGGAGGGRGSAMSGKAAISGSPFGLCWFQPARNYTCQWCPTTNTTTLLRAGGGGGSICSGVSGLIIPWQVGGAGGGGGRGNAGNAGGASSTPSGSAGTPSTFNCVPVTPGSPYPITVGGPAGGQVVISWNPQ